MHWLVGRFYFALTIVTAITVYGAMLPAVAADPASVSAQWVFAGLSWALALFVAVTVIRFSQNLFTAGATTQEALWGYADCTVAVIHALAAVGMSIFLLDQSPAKDAWIVGVDLARGMYSIYVGNFLIDTLNVFVSAGYATLSIRSGGVVGALWGMSINATTIVFGVALLSVLLNHITMHVIKRQRDVTSNMLTAQTAQYRGWLKPEISKRRRRRGPAAPDGGVVFF